MRTSDATLLFVPGWTGSGPDHWQSRWQAKLSTALRVQQRDWDQPVLADWVAALTEAVALSTRPVVIVAHSLGATTTVHAAAGLGGRVAGALLAAPPSRAFILDSPDIPPDFAAFPLDPLPFPSVLAASRTDALCSYGEAGDLALSWGAALADAGDAGHINTASGHGPWPEGLMCFAGFMRQL